MGMKNISLSFHPPVSSPTSGRRFLFTAGVLWPLYLPCLLIYHLLYLFRYCGISGSKRVQCLWPSRDDFTVLQLETKAVKKGGELDMEVAPAHYQ